MNSEIFDAFIDAVDGSKILEIGLRPSALDYARIRFDVESYDIGTSRFKYDMNSVVKQNMFVRFPFDDGEFNGSVCNSVLHLVGDRVYFIKELMRITRGPILLYDVSIDAFPMKFFEERDDIFVINLSVDGKVMDIDQTAADFASRVDLKRLFYRPGGVLNKFSMLVPEDVKTECGMLIRKIK